MALGPPQIAAVAINLVLLLVIFRTQLSGRYEFEHVPRPDPRAVRMLVTACCIAVAYLVALTLEWPIGPIAVAGAVAALASARVRPTLVIRHIGWGTLALIGGLFVMLDAVARSGFVVWAQHALAIAQSYGPLASLASAACGAAVLSNVLNNLPVAIASSYAVAHAPHAAIAYPLIAGVDVGPNMLTTGSLATLLWWSILHDRGVRVSAREYARIGIVLVPPTLAVVVVWLWFVA